MRLDDSLRRDPRLKVTEAPDPMSDAFFAYYAKKVRGAGLNGRGRCCDLRTSRLRHCKRFYCLGEVVYFYAAMRRLLGC